MMSDRDVDLSTQPRQPEASLGELFSSMTQDLSRLTRQEIQLAKVELQEEARQFGKGAGFLVGAAVCGLLAAILLTMSASWLLDQWMPRALAFLIIAAVLAGAAAVLAMQGRARVASVNPMPEQTIDTLKEDIAWAKAQRG